MAYDRTQLLGQPRIPGDSQLRWSQLREDSDALELLADGKIVDESEEVRGDRGDRFGSQPS